MKTGEFQYAFTTLTLSGPIPVQLVHTYGNQKNYNAYYGPNWTINYDLKISVSQDQSKITLYGFDASFYTYQKISSNPDRYTLIGNPHTYIVETTSNNYELVVDSGIRYQFYDTASYWLALRGTLSWIKDKHENQVSFARDTRGRITTITDCFGRYTYLAYDSSSPYYLRSITDFKNRTWSFYYDGDTGDLLSIKYPATNDYPNGLSYDLDYDSVHNLTYIYDPNDDQIVRIYYEYDSVNQVYKANKQDLAGGQYQITYNPSSKKATVVDRESHKVDIYYTDQGLVSKRIVYTDNPNANPNSFTTEYLYNSVQKNTRIIYPEGNCTDFTFNSDGFTTGIYRKTSPSEPNDPDDPDVIATLYTYVDSSNPLLYSKVDMQTDPEGNVTDYDYDNDGMLTKVTLPDIDTPSGLFSTIYEYTYTGDGLINTVEDPNGVITKYVYYNTSSSDPNNGLLWKVIVDYGTGQDYLNLTTEYAYDALQRVRMVTDPNGAATAFSYNALNQRTETVDALGYTTKFGYDYNGNLRKIEKETSDPANPWQTTELTYNTWRKLTKIQDALGNEMTYGYDNNERRTSVTNALDEQTTLTYDERGLLTKVTDPNEGETIYTYNDNGNRLSVIDPNGNATTYEYDGLGRMVKVTDAEDHYRTKEYDKNGRVIMEIAYDNGDTALMQSRYAYNEAGELVQYAMMADAASTAAVDPNDDKVTEYSYAWANGPMLEETVYYGGIATTNAVAATTHYAYDAAGRKIAVEDPDGNTTGYSYDKNGRLARIQKLDHNPVSGGSDLLQTTDFEYDSLGRLTARIEKPQNPDAQSDSSWQRTEYQYDALNNRIEETKPNGVITNYEYDLLGRKIKMIADPNSPSYPDRINQVTEYAYDAIGRQISISGYAKDNDASTKQTTGYEYDNIDRITKITYPDNATIRYAYTDTGKVWKRTDQRGIETYYTYDDVYNMTQKTVTMGSTTTTETFGYDGLGRMLSAQKLEGQTQVSLSEFAYNDKGRISDGWETILALSEKHIQYAYDNAGNLTQTVYPNGLQIGRSNTWDGRIDTLTRTSGTAYKFAEFDYIGSRVAQRRYGPDAGIKMYYKPQYDNLGRMTRSYTYKAANPNTTITDFVYSYVAEENNIDRMQFDHRQGTPYNQFTYDNLDRVTDVTYLSNQNDVEEFPMDDLGNRVGNVTQRDGVHNYTIATPNLTNRYTAIDSAAITHDAAGNLTLDKDGYHYTYDYENRVTRIYKLDGQTEVNVAEYVYDALGRRVQKIDSIAAKTTYYTYNDQWQILEEQESGQQYPRLYVYGNYIDEVLAKFSTTTGYPVYFTQDHLYSPAAAMNYLGMVIERYEYDVYGKTKIMDSAYNLRSQSLYTSFTFTGRQLDILDGGNLQHMHYRYRDYSPFMGRFIQHDPLGLIPNIDIPYVDIPFIPKAQYIDGINLYQYVKSSPVGSVDPYGEVISAGAGVCIGVGATIVCAWIPAELLDCEEGQTKWETTYDDCYDCDGAITGQRRRETEYICRNHWWRGWIGRWESTGAYRTSPCD